MTLNELFDQWYEQYARTVLLTTANETHSYLSLRVLSEIGELDINGIKPKMILDVANGIAVHSTYYAKRAVADIARIYDYACILDITDKNPAARVSRYVETHKVVGHNFVSPKQVPTMLAAVDTHASSSASVMLAFWTIVYTAVRRQEAVFAKKSEFDFNDLTWTIPPERMKVKNGKPHIVPLSAQLAILLSEYFDSNNSIYAFPAKSMLLPINAWSPYYVLKKAGWAGKQTLHGFRKIFSSHAHNIGLWSIDAIELSLAHAIPGVRGVYNHAEYFDERAELMQWYADQVDNWRGLDMINYLQIVDAERIDYV